jgi:hypothetical protein
VNVLEQIRAALATQAGKVDGLSGYSYVPGQINAPAAVVAPQEISYDADLSDGATVLLPVQVLVSLGDLESAHRAMDDLVAPDGALVALLNACQDFDTRVVGMDRYGDTEYASSTYLGAVLTVEVYC